MEGLPKGNSLTKRRRSANKNDTKQAKCEEVVTENNGDDKARNTDYIADSLCDKSRCEGSLLKEEHVNNYGNRT